MIVGPIMMTIMNLIQLVIMDFLHGNVKTSQHAIGSVDIVAIAFID